MAWSSLQRRGSMTLCSDSKPRMNKTKHVTASEASNMRSCVNAHASNACHAAAAKASASSGQARPPRAAPTRECGHESVIRAHTCQRRRCPPRRPHKSTDEGEGDDADTHGAQPRTRRERTAWEGQQEKRAAVNRGKSRGGPASRTGARSREAPTGERAVAHAYRERRRGRRGSEKPREHLRTSPVFLL
eukprot:scaffold168911_cov39-Tisochrysis_lutea.AAC.3